MQLSCSSKACTAESSADSSLANCGLDSSALVQATGRAHTSVYAQQVQKGVLSAV
jgi:hypothetical protein